MNQIHIIKSTNFSLLSIQYFSFLQKLTNNFQVLRLLKIQETTICELQPVETIDLMKQQKESNPITFLLLIYSRPKHSFGSWGHDRQIRDQGKRLEDNRHEKKSCPQSTQLAHQELVAKQQFEQSNFQKGNQNIVGGKSNRSFMDQPLQSR